MKCADIKHLSVVFQNLLKSTGAQGKTTVFLITDTQIKEESFLEDIDNLLNTGEVPNLFATDEKAEIMEVRVWMVDCFSAVCRCRKIASHTDMSVHIQFGMHTHSHTHIHT